MNNAQRRSIFCKQNVTSRVLSKRNTYRNWRELMPAYTEIYNYPYMREAAFQLRSHLLMLRYQLPQFFLPAIRSVLKTSLNSAPVIVNEADLAFAKHKVVTTNVFY